VSPGIESYSFPLPCLLSPAFKLNVLVEDKVSMDTLSSTKEARIYNGLKTISLTSGAGKSGQPLVKE